MSHLTVELCLSFQLTLQALSAIDQPSLNSFSTALHGTVTEPDTINLITSYTSPATIPTLAVAMNRAFIHADTFVQGYNGESSGNGAMSHMAHSQLSPRLHSLPDNVLSPLGLLAEASLQNTQGKQGRYGRSPMGMGRNGSSHLREGSVDRAMLSDVRGGEVKGDESKEGEEGKKEGEGAVSQESGLASQNYFKPVGVGVHVGPPGNRVSHPIRTVPLGRS